jgi:hypothetical protein
MQSLAALLSAVLLLSFASTPAAAQCNAWTTLPSLPVSGYVGEVTEIPAVAVDESTDTVYAAVHCWCGWHGAVNAVVCRSTPAGGWIGMPIAGDVSSVEGMAVVDDGVHGPMLYAWGGNSTGFRRWNATAWQGVAAPSGATVAALTAADLGDGVHLYAGTNRGVYRLDGATWVQVGAIPAGPPPTWVGQLAVFDDGTGPALYAAGSFTSIGGTSANHVAAWRGGVSSWTTLGSGLSTVTANFDVSTMRVVHDESGDALYFGGRFDVAGGIATENVARWDGSAWSGLPPVAPGPTAYVTALADFDDGSGHGRELYASGRLWSTPYTPFVRVLRGGAWQAVLTAANGVPLHGPIVTVDLPATPGRDLLAVQPLTGGERYLTRFDACNLIGEFACSGDGTTMPCPCGNSGASTHGCASSLFPEGAWVTASGTASVIGDTLRLSGTSMPNVSCTYFQGTEIAPVHVYDGILCLGGSLLRLGSKINVGNASSYPEAGDAPISIRGQIPAVGGTYSYTARYRNAAPFCTPATANYANAVRVVWTP